MEDLALKVGYLMALLLASAFFSFSEIALAASRRSRLQIALDKGDARAKSVMEMQDKPGPFFSVVQLGLNAVAILGGVVGDTAFSPYLESLFLLFMPADYAAKSAFFASFFLVTVTFVVFADLIPKRLTFNNPERTAMNTVGIMSFMIKAFGPLVTLLDWCSSVLIRLMGGTAERKDRITSDDILASVGAGAAAGIIAPAELSVIENVFDLENRYITTAMTPRESIVFFLETEKEDEIRRQLASAPHSRYLVCKEDLDHITGVISSKDVLRRIIDNKPMSLSDPSFVHPVQFVPDTLTLAEILKHFQKTSTDFAVILNEYAIVVGIVTLDDVMSTVMGDLVVTPEESQIMKRDEHSWLVDGSTPTIDVAYTLDIDIPTEDRPYETLAGFIMYALRRIPKRTDYIVYKGYRFEVMDVDANRIDQVLVTKLAKDGKVKKSNAPATETVLKAPAKPGTPVKTEKGDKLADKAAEPVKPELASK